MIVRLLKTNASSVLGESFQNSRSGRRQLPGLLILEMCSLSIMYDDLSFKTGTMLE